MFLGEPSMFVRQDPPGLLKIGDSVVLKCEVEGNPPPDVYWSRNSRRIHSNIYTIPKIQASDVGRYTCTANNTKAQAHHDIFLHVLCKSVFLIKSRNFCLLLISLIFAFVKNLQNLIFANNFNVYNYIAIFVKMLKLLVSNNIQILQNTKFYSRQIKLVNRSNL